MEFKGTKGHHQLMFNSNICFGIGVKSADNPNYYHMTCNTILPDTDEKYEIEKDEIIANMKLYAAAPELLEALETLIDALDVKNNETTTYIETCIKYGKAAINKAIHP